MGSLGMHRMAMAIVTFFDGFLSLLMLVDVLGCHVFSLNRDQFPNLVDKKY